jgi:hypothetical protein
METTVRKSKTMMINANLHLSQPALDTQVVESTSVRVAGEVQREHAAASRVEHPKVCVSFVCHTIPTQSDKTPCNTIHIPPQTEGNPFYRTDL